MSSPLPPDLAVELFYGGAWHDITADVRVAQPVTARYGQPDEAARPDPSTCTLLLNNRHGRYSWRNPRSELFGLIGRNTPMRYRLGPSDVALALPGAGDAHARTVSDPALDVTGDLDIRAELAPATWRPDGSIIVAARYRTPSTTGRAWMLLLTATGALQLLWSPDGTVDARLGRSSTVPVPAETGRAAVRAVLDVDNGADGHTVRFYTAPSMAGPWTLLGDEVTAAGITAVHAADADVTIGSAHGGATSTAIAGVQHHQGLVYAVQVRDGIDGPAVADADFTAGVVGRDELVDAAGREWALLGGATLHDAAERWRGEVSEWPVRWDLSGNDVWTPITGSGVLRRLGQGEAPLESSLRRDLSSRDNIVAYWPLEDGRDAATFAPSIGPWVMYPGGDVDPATYTDLPASAPLPVIHAGRIYGNVAPYTPDADQRVMALVDLPDGGVDADVPLLYLHTTGTTQRWILSLTTAGALAVRALGVEGVEVVADTMTSDARGLQGLVWVLLEQAGSDLDWQIGYLPVGATVATVRYGTLAGHTYGRVTHVRVGSVSSIDAGGMAVGHIAVMNGDVHSAFWDTASTSLVAWAGETAGARMARIAAEADIPLTVLGDLGRPDATTPMGPMRRDTPLNVIAECAVADMGLLTDRHGRLQYRPRTTLYSQAPALELDYAQCHVSEPFEPLDDDQLLRNDVTVARVDGSSARAVLQQGPLSIQPPPDGVGRYEESLTLNLASDTQLPDQAAWRLHLGTVDELRVATVRVNLAHPALHGMVEQVMAVTEGDRITITNLPDWMPPGPLDLIVRHIEEGVGITTLERTFTCVPGRPWQVWVLEDDRHGRADTLDSTTTAEFTSGVDTELGVATGRGPIWTTDPAELPFDITVGGAQLRVLSITGETSPQTFTVDQTPVNGVTRTIPASTAVRLAYPAVVAL